MILDLNLRLACNLCVLLVSSDRPVSAMLKSRAGAAIWRWRKRMRLADGAAHA
jgi:hypothetical protein